MVLAVVETSWNLFLIFLFVVLPIVFIFGLKKELNKEQSESKTKSDEIPLANSSEVTYRTVMNEAGSYTVISSNNEKASVTRQLSTDLGKHWTVSVKKNGEIKTENTKTKKEAVAAAIELMK